MSLTLKNDKSLCFILPGWATKHTGGAEWQCYLISETLLNKGWNIEVITYGSKKDKKQHEKSYYYNSSIDYHYVSNYRRFKLISFIEVLLVLLRTNSNFYYNRTDARIMRAASNLFCKLFKKKSIYALASDVELSIKSEYLFLRENKNNNPVRLLDAYLIDLIIKKQYFKSDLILTQSYFQKEELVKEYGIQSHMIRNSIQLDKVPESTKENIVLWVGNMHNIKQPELFIKLSNQINDTNWKFVMIGNHFNREEILSAGVNPNLQIISELSYEETLKWFSRAKILVNTSNQEGFSNTFLQAWIYKVLIISLSVDPDQLISKGLGIYCNNNFSELCSSTSEILNSYNQSSRILIKAQLFASIEFDLKLNIKKLTDLLTESEDKSKSRLENRNSSRADIDAITA